MATPLLEIGELPNPQRQSLSDGRPGYKVFVAYPHNPEEYSQLTQPDVDSLITQNPDLTADVIWREFVEAAKRHEEELKQKIAGHKQLVLRFARFLQGASVAVSYDQLLTDTGAGNVKLWIEQQIKDSDFIILIVTPSFYQFLTDKSYIPPGKERTFVGHDLYNYIHNPPQNIRILPVFLNRWKDISLLPKSLEAASLYEIWEPLHVSPQVPRQDDLEALYCLLTKQNRYQQPQVPTGNSIVKIPPRRRRFGEGVVNSSELRVGDRDLYDRLSVNQQPVDRDALTHISQRSEFSAHWRGIAGKLDLSEAEIEHCQGRGMGSQEEACFQMLMLWVNSRGPQATVAVLASAVFRTRNFPLLRIVNEICTK